MFRTLPVLTVIVLASAQAACIGQAPSPNQPVDISGVFLGGNAALSVEERHRAKPVAGGEPPLLPEAKALYEQRIASQATSRPWADTEVACLPAGMPRLSLTIPPYPFEILQTPGQITILFEALSMVRRIRLNRDHHPDDIFPTWMGDSIGWWEDDTLVVDTIGLNGRSTVDKAGMPMSDRMHVVERIRWLNDDTLENLITIEDPSVFSRPWTTRMTYVRQPPDTEVQEFICEGSNLRTVRDAEGYILGLEGAVQ